jgi:hypothetical protein
MLNYKLFSYLHELFVIFDADFLSEGVSEITFFIFISGRLTPWTLEYSFRLLSDSSSARFLSDLDK